MIRKFMVGAVVAAMPLALLTATSGATAPKPSITAVTYSQAIDQTSAPATTLTQAAVKDATTLHVASTDGFHVNDLLNVGDGSVLVTSVNAGALTLGIDGTPYDLTKVTGLAATPNGAAVVQVNGGQHLDGTIGYGNMVKISFTGTILTQAAASITIKAGWAGEAWTVIASSNNATSGTIYALAPNPTAALALGLLAHGLPKEKPSSISIGGATWKTGASLGSNCGALPAVLNPGDKPINSETGVAYTSGNFASGTPTPPLVSDVLQSTLMSPATLFTNVYVVSTGLLSFPAGTQLCAADLTLKANGLGATDTLNAAGNETWGSNYGLYFTTPVRTSSGTGVSTKVGPNVTDHPATFHGIAFALPYTSTAGVAVQDNYQYYNIPKKLDIGACAADTASDQPSVGDGLGGRINTTDTNHHYFRDNAVTTCKIGTLVAGTFTQKSVADGGNVIQVYDSANHNFTAGTFLDAPSFGISGLKTTKAGAYAFSLNSIVTVISLAGVNINIGFNPTPKSASSKVAAFTLNLS